MDDAAIIAEVERRNAIRVAAFLPPLDIEAEVQRALWLAKFHNFNAVSDTYADERARIRAEVVEEFRGKYGVPQTMNANIWIGHHTRRRFAEFMARQTGLLDPLLGPRPDEIKYGSDRQQA